MDNKILDSLFNGDFRTFKQEVTSALYSKLNSRLEDATAEVANYTFHEELENKEKSVDTDRLYTESTEDVKFKELVNHSDKNGFPEGSKDVDATEKGGEFLVDLSFLEGNETKLENFRVVGTSKADIETKLNNFFGKGKFVIDNIKLSEEALDEQRFYKGEDIGKPGLGFKKVAAKAAEEYGSKEAGKRVAGAVLKKILAKKGKKKVNEESEKLDESKSDYKIYHNSYTSAVEEARRHAESKGYKHNDDEVFDTIGSGPSKPSDGKTNRFSLNLYKDGNKVKEMHHIQIYGMGDGKYELNQYMDKPSRRKKIKEDIAQIDETSKEKLTSYTKASSKDLADRERNFYNPNETDVMNIVTKASKIGQRKLGIEQAQNKLASGDYDAEKPSKVTMKATYKPKKKESKVSSKAMKELQPDFSTDNKQVKEDTVEESYGKAQWDEKTRTFKERPEVDWKKEYPGKSKPYSGEYHTGGAVGKKLKELIKQGNAEVDAKKKVNECSTYNGDYDYKNDDKSKEYATHYESFSAALDAAKEHAKASGFKHDPEEFSIITNKGFIKPKENKTHAFHVGLYHEDGKEAMSKIHSFQISGKGDGKFHITQDIK